jgi:hypothetical protein
MGRTVCTEPQCLYEGDLYFLLYLKVFLPDESQLLKKLSTFMRIEIRTAPEQTLSLFI